MDSKGDKPSNVDLTTGPSTSSSEGQQFNSENKPKLSFSQFPSELTPQDHNNFMPNATTPLTNDQTYSQPESHHNTSSMMEKEVESSINSHLEALPSNPFGEPHLSPLLNDSSPSSLPSQPPQNPFLLHSDSTDTTQPSSVMQQENGGMTNSSTDEIQDLHSSFAPSTYESSPVNPFQVPTISTTTTGLQEVVENHDHEHERHHHSLPLIDQDHWSFPSDEARTHNPSETHASSSSQQLDPLFTLESAQNNQLDGGIIKNHEEHNNMASGNLETDTITPVVGESSSFNPRKKLGSSVSSFSTASESSTQDQMQINASSNNNKGDTNLPPKFEKDSLLNLESSDDDIPISSMPKHEQQQSSDVASSSTNRIPSHVFASNKSKTQWSTASNESLFSIQMGNTSFCNDMAWLNKSGEVDKPSDMNASQNNQPPLPQQQQQPQEAKFNDISQSTTEQHEGVTEEKAAETMREVIMENSVTTGNKSKGELTFADRETHSNMLSKSNDPSHPSNGSTKSFAFKVSTDKDKTPSSKRGEERRHQKKQSQQQTLTERPAAAQNPKSAPNASQNKWLCCFTCCH